MKKHFNSAGLLRWSGICSLTVFALHLAGQMAAAPATAVWATIPRPVKLAISATARNVGDGTTVEVEVSLRDAANQPLTARVDLTADIEARQFSGVQKTNVIIKAGDSSGHCSVPLHEGGIIELWATQRELRPDTTLVRVKPFALASSQSVPGFTPNPPTGTPAAPESGTHLGREASKIGGTARDISDAARSVHDTVHQLGSLFGLTTPGGGQPGFLAGSVGRSYLADNQDAAIIQIFLGRPVSKRTEIQLDCSSGKLEPATVAIGPGEDTGQTRLTAGKVGTITVKCVNATPKIKLPPTNTLSFSFKPPIVRLNVRASPPQISLLDTAELLVQLQDINGEPIATDEPRSISTAIVSGSAEIPSLTHAIQPGEFETRIAFRPTRCGTVGIKAFADTLPPELGEVRVSLPMMLLSLSALGGSLGGLLAAFSGGLPLGFKNGSLRRRLTYLPWWRMVVGLITGFVLYWSFIFLSFSALPKGVILNPFSALVCSLLGGWMGLNVFSLVLKRLHLLKTEEPAAAPAVPRGAKA